MRILLAIDGSPSSDKARDLVAALPWREGGLVRIVTVAPDVDDLDASVLGSYEDALETAEREIRSAHAHLVIEPVLVLGRPASVIVDAAAAMGADLIVIGHRGLSRWETILLGSVATEVIDQAPCAVLIARDERLGPVVLGDDGSTHARRAETVVRDWPLFAGLPVTIVTVTDEGYPYVTAVAPPLHAETVAGQGSDSEGQGPAATVAMTSAVDRLREAGIDAVAEERRGDPAHELVACARERGAGLIVVGTRGQTGLRRLLLGSVARNVTLHARCSVLVVRGAASHGGRWAERGEPEMVSAFG